jgi:hypothetical protein
VCFIWVHVESICNFIVGNNNNDINNNKSIRKNYAALLTSITITALEVVSLDVKKFTLYPDSKFERR